MTPAGLPATHPYNEIPRTSAFGESPVFRPRHLSVKSLGGRHIVNRQFEPHCYVVVHFLLQRALRSGHVKRPLLAACRQ